METMVLLKDASTLAKPDVTFFEPLALRTLIVPSSSFRRSSAVGCLATPWTISTGLAGAAGSPAAGAPAAGAPAAGAAPSAGLPALSPFGPLDFFSAPAAGAAAAAGAPPSAAGFAGF